MGKKKKKKPKSKPPVLKDQKTSQQFTGVFGSEEISYTATAATQVFETNEEKVSFFYISYTKDDADPGHDRFSSASTVAPGRRRCG